MRVVVAVVLLAITTTGCSGARTDEAAPSTTASQPDTQTTQSAATSPSSPMVAASEEPTHPLFSGARGVRWYRAWDELDVDTLATFFADDAIVNGTLFANAMTVARQRHPDPIDWQETFEDCVYQTERYATCDVLWTSAVHDPAGLEVPVHRSVYFDEEGLITLYRDEVRLDAIVSFEYAIAEWLATHHPDIPPIDWNADSYASYAASVEGVLGIVDEFVAWSDDYPPAAPVIDDPILTHSVEGIQVYNATEDQVALVQWALDRFRLAGLPVPPVTAIVFPPTVACASGTSGRAYHDGTEGTIDVCTEPVAFVGSDLPMSGRRTILHELGHLWVVGHTPAEAQDRFMAQRGVTEWTGTVWEDCGAEHAAEIMMWALVDEPVLPRLSAAAPGDLREAYTILTGHSPP